MREDGLTQPESSPSGRSGTGGGAVGVQVKVRSLSEVDQRFQQAWLDLEQNARTRNPFQSANYVLAAARNLTEACPPVILSIESGRDLMGLCVFDNVTASRRLPVRHLRAWQTPHTYYDAPLLRPGFESQAMEAFWNFFLRGAHDWHGVAFPRFPEHDPVTSVFDETSQAERITCLKGTRWERASLDLASDAGANVLQHLSIKRAKSLRRGWRELEKLGEVRFEIQQDPEQIERCTEELLHLENLGWKADVGSALASQRTHQKFFREMIAGFARQQDVFFSRILVNGRSVINVVNLVANETAYAFKLGWDPQTERGCPGFQVKLQTALQGQSQLSGIQLIDSCSAPGSFIEHVWPGRRAFCHRLYVTSPVGNLTASMVSGLRWVRDTSRAVSRKLFNHESSDGLDTCTDR